MIGIECGQSFFSLRSWLVCDPFRTFPGGFAVGPVMFWRAR